MKIHLPIALFILVQTGAFANDRTNEIGWEDGIRYAKRFGSYSIGARISPGYTYSEGEDPSSNLRFPGSQSDAASTRNLERRRIYLGIQGAKEYKYFNYVAIEPYTELGYGFIHAVENSVNTTNGRDVYAGSNIADNTISIASVESYNNVLSFAIGLKPGLKLNDAFKIYTKLGLDFNVDISRRYDESRQETRYADETRWSSSFRRNRGTTWNVNSFGNTSLSSGIFLSVQF